LTDLALSVVLFNNEIEEGRMFKTISLMMASLKRKAEELGLTLVGSGDMEWERHEDSGRVTIRFETKPGDDD